MSAGITDTSTHGHPGFRVAHEITADAAIVRVRGDLDHTTIPHVDDHLHAATAAPTPSALVVLDLSHVSFLGSAGLSVLITHHRRCALQGRQLRIIATTSAVLRPIALTGLDDILSIATTVHEPSTPATTRAARETASLEDADSLTDRHWFPDGTEVTVVSGPYAGDHGVVVNHAPDLRPGTAWVELAALGTHLVPTYRLTHRNTHHDTA